MKNAFILFSASVILSACSLGDGTKKNLDLDASAAINAALLGVTIKDVDTMRGHFVTAFELQDQANARRDVANEFRNRANALPKDADFRSLGTSAAVATLKVAGVAAREAIDDNQGPYRATLANGITLNYGAQSNTLTDNQISTIARNAAVTLWGRQPDGNEASTLLIIGREIRDDLNTQPIDKFASAFTTIIATTYASLKR